MIKEGKQKIRSKQQKQVENKIKEERKKKDKAA